MTPESDSTAWREAHRSLSEVDLRFREIAISSPDFLSRSHFRAIDHNPEALSNRLQPWLTFVGRRKLEELKRASLAVAGLLRNLRERIFHKDWAKLAAFYRLGSPAIAEILLSPPTGAETMFARGDFIDTAGGFKCIEFNCLPTLGGWDTGILLRRHPQVPATARFLASESIRVASSDPLLEICRHIFADLRNKGLAAGGEVNIGFVLSPDTQVLDDSPRIALYQREMGRAIEALGLDLTGRVVTCSYQSLVERERALYQGRLRIDALLEINSDTPPHVYRLFKRGRVALYNGPIARILSTKRNIALLSQHATGGSFSPAERDLIEAYIPWTRLVAPGAVEYKGEALQLPDLLAARRERFVLKKADSSGGKGVLIGRFTLPEEWRQTIDLALAQGNWVVQELQESLPYIYQNGDYGCCLHDVIWGPFVFGDRYGGVFLRMQPKTYAGPVNAGRAATEGGVVEV